MFLSDWLRNLFAKAAAVLPADPIWRWAESAVWLEKKHAPEEGYYSSAKTPWTRWLQEIGRAPWRMRLGLRRRVRKVVIRKCTQSGFTEAILNIIRWRVRFRPANFLYAIDSKEQALKIRSRLVDTLARLGENILEPGKEVGDLKQYILQFRECFGWFSGSYSAGAFSNSFAPLVVLDEYDQHSVSSANASTASMGAERTKAADGEDLVILLSKPEHAGGPTDKEHAAGDQHDWWVPCPHCGTYQTLVWDRVRFSHCRDLIGGWDLDAILGDTWYQCASDEKCRIVDDHKRWMEERGVWVWSKAGDPEIVSLSMTDLHSRYTGSTFGHLAKEFVAASEAASRGNLKLLQAWENGRMGQGHEARVEKFTLTDLLKCRGPYKRGIIPRAGLMVIEGCDIGLVANNRWVDLAVDPVTTEAWIIDCGTARGPEDAIDRMRRTRYLCPATGQHQGIALIFIDCRYRREEVYATCLKNQRQIFPTQGMKQGSSARSIAFTLVPQAPDGFGIITYIDEDAKYALYVDAIKHQRPPRLHFPSDAEQSFLLEFCVEPLIRDPVTGRVSFPPKPRGPNHAADCVKIARTGYDYMIDGPRTRAGEAPPLTEQGMAVSEVARAFWPADKPGRPVDPYYPDEV